MALEKDAPSAWCNDATLLWGRARHWCSQYKCAPWYWRFQRIFLPKHHVAQNLIGFPTFYTFENQRSRVHSLELENRTFCCGKPGQAVDRTIVNEGFNDGFNDGDSQLFVTQWTLKSRRDNKHLKNISWRDSVSQWCDFHPRRRIRPEQDAGCDTWVHTSVAPPNFSVTSFAQMNFGWFDVFGTQSLEMTPLLCG